MNGTWSYEEDENCWQLFYLPVGGMMPMQILKAAKQMTPFAEYWPDSLEAKFIVDALNKESMRFRSPLELTEFYPEDTNQGDSNAHRPSDL